jgi:hypothetical protein
MMGMFGKILATPVRIVNAPLRAMEKIVDPADREEDRIASRPLEAVAEALEEVDGTTDKD